jgi:two-component system phosphate regulon sensor histidine kinase PhoR
VLVTDLEHKMFHSIQTRISIVYILFTTLMLLILGIAVSVSFESYLKTKIKDELEHEIELITFTVKEHFGGGMFVLDQKLKGLVNNQEKRITLIDNSGKVMLDTDFELHELSKLENHISLPEIAEASKNKIGMDERINQNTNIGYLYIAKKIENLSEFDYLKNLSYIRISITLNELNSILSDVRTKILYIGLFVLFLILILSRWISYRISKPIKKIVEELEEFRKGNFEHRIQLESEDEIGSLANSINHLAQKLSDDIKELDRLSKVRSQFLANVSHELRTPLFSAQAFIETLIDGALTDNNVNREYLIKAKFNLDRLNDLLNDLIDISRIESKEMKLSFRYFNLLEFLSQEIEKFQILDKQKKSSVEIACEPEFNPQVYGDKLRLSQVIQNLLDNAIRHNPNGTSVIIKVLQVNHQALITVIDNGKGIPEEHLPRLFERFYRVDTSSSGESEGTGLGLAIVKHILEAHNSKIEVESTVGVGTKFSFSLQIG